MALTVTTAKPEPKCGTPHSLTRAYPLLEIRCSAPKGHLPSGDHEARVKWTERP